MIAPLVYVAMTLDWWPRFLALAGLLGAHVEERGRGDEAGEVVVYTGRCMEGAWVVG